MTGFLETPSQNQGIRRFQSWKKHKFYVQSMIPHIETYENATGFPETTSNFQVKFSLQNVIDVRGQVFSADLLKLWRGFWKPHQTFRCPAKDIWQPIMFLGVWPKIFGNQSCFRMSSQRYLATNHVLGCLAKDIWRDMFWELYPWPLPIYWYSNQETPVQRACHAAQSRHQEM